MGELFIWTDIDPAHEGDFNQWYDREHMAERAGIPGFSWARRYRAATLDGHQPARRYLALYRTESMGVFGSEPYRKAFTQQTEWSLTNFGRMGNTCRRVMIVSPLAGVGTGAALGLLQLGDLLTAERAAALAAELAQAEGALTVRVLTPDPELSTPLPSEDPAGRVLEPVLLVDATTPEAAAAAIRLAAEKLALGQDKAHIYSLLWDLQSSDLQASR